MSEKQEEKTLTDWYVSEQHSAPIERNCVVSPKSRRCKKRMLLFGMPVLFVLLTRSPFLLHLSFRLSLLSQYRLCAAGIGLGTAYSLRYKKGLVPMVAAGAIGTTADMVYGYLVECADFRQQQETLESPTTGMLDSNDTAAAMESPTRPKGGR